MASNFFNAAANVTRNAIPASLEEAATRLATAAAAATRNAIPNSIEEAREAAMAKIQKTVQNVRDTANPRNVQEFLFPADGKTPTWMAAGFDFDEDVSSNDDDDDDDDDNDNDDLNDDEDDEDDFDDGFDDNYDDDYDNDYDGNKNEDGDDDDNYKRDNVDSNGLHTERCDFGAIKNGGASQSISRKPFGIQPISENLELPPAPNEIKDTSTRPCASLMMGSGVDFVEPSQPRFWFNRFSQSASIPDDHDSPYSYGTATAAAAAAAAASALKKPWLALFAVNEFVVTQLEQSYRLCRQGTSYFVRSWQKTRFSKRVIDYWALNVLFLVTLSVIGSVVILICEIIATGNGPSPSPNGNTNDSSGSPGAGQDDTDANDGEASKMGYFDCLFLAASAVSGTGLTAFSLNQTSTGTVVIVYILMTAGSKVLLAIPPVLLRRYIYRRDAAHYVTRRGEFGLLPTAPAENELLDDIHEQLDDNDETHGPGVGLTGNVDFGSIESGLSREINGEVEQLTSLGRLHDVHNGREPLAGLLTVDEDAGAGNSKVLLSVGEGLGGEHGALSRFRTLSTGSVASSMHSRAQFITSEAHLATHNRRQQTEGFSTRVDVNEYNAAGILVKILLSYIVIVQLFGFFGFWIYARLSITMGDILKKSNVSPLAWAVFQTSAAFYNTGLSLLPNSMRLLMTEKLVITITIFLVMLGNCLFPIMLRWTIIALSRQSFFTPITKDGLRYLIQNPRRSSIHLFEDRETMILLLTWLSFILIQVVFMMAIELFRQSLQYIPTGIKIGVIFFQSISNRTAGFTIIETAAYSKPVQILFSFILFMDCYPLLLTIKYTGANFKSSAARMKSHIQTPVVPSKPHEQAPKLSPLQEAIRDAAKIGEQSAKEQKKAAVTSSIKRPATLVTSDRSKRKRSPKTTFPRPAVFSLPLSSSSPRRLFYSSNASPNAISQNSIPIPKDNDNEIEKSKTEAPKISTGEISSSLGNTLDADHDLVQESVLKISSFEKIKSPKRKRRKKPKTLAAATFSKPFISTTPASAASSSDSKLRGGPPGLEDAGSPPSAKHSPENLAGTATYSEKEHFELLKWIMTDVGIIYAFLLVIITAEVAGNDDADVFDVMFEVIACYSTVGLTVLPGLNGRSFELQCTVVSKIILIICMWLGHSRSVPSTLDYSVAKKLEKQKKKKKKKKKKKNIISNYSSCNGIRKKEAHHHNNVVQIESSNPNH